MNNSSLSIIILSIILVILIFRYFHIRKETFVMNLKRIDLREYDKYIKGEKVTKLFTDDFIKKYESNDLYYLPKKMILLYRLYKELMKIDYFTEDLFLELIH